MTGLHFPFRFDTDLLRADLATARTVEWPPHYNEQDYGGGWSGVALRSATGDSSQLAAGHTGSFAGTFKDTPLLDRCPYFRQVLSVFQCPLKSARLLSLAPQSFIREHSDHALGYDDGEIRIHIPIQTNPGVEFYVAGERLALEEGHSYFINVNLPHRVNNRGPAERVHLVIDAEVNDWVHALFRRGVEEHWDVPRSERPPRNLDDFRRHVLDDPALQKELQVLESRTSFVSMVLAAGRERGFEFHEGDIEAAFRGGPMAHIEGTPMPVTGWTPVRVFFRDRIPVAEWVYTGSRRFTEPFFEQSVKIALRNPFARFFRREIPLDVGNEAESGELPMKPSGFVFHMSRCGSTLISQMLAAPQSHLVIAEAEPIDNVIQAKQSVADLTGEEHVRWLRRIVAALGRRRPVHERAYVIKLDAWHIRGLPLLRAAFPNTPWIFVYRDPLEVMVSQLARPGRLNLPGAMDPSILGLEPGDVTGLSREAWCAGVLKRFLCAALAARQDSHGLFVSYSDLPDAVFGPIAKHFGITLSDQDVSAMRETTLFHTKTPAFSSQPVSGEKRAMASPAVREVCREQLDGLFEQLRSCS
ncbi:MAG TPA: aspartyl/asparaginyl beta-hydroxylase domain-containing protein [Bryobacteraceae bacterium]|nr:aspartyl/asparaginyl beta-hydroxylase domain-containing protein [Bryobacteraceae bacterium]